MIIAHRNNLATFPGQHKYLWAGQPSFQPAYAAATGELIDTSNTYDITAENESVEMSCDGTQWWIVSGYLE